MQDILTDFIGYVAGTYATIISVPQIYKVIKTKSAHDVAIWTIVLLMTTSFLYTIYGFLIGSLPLIITDIAAFILNTIMLILRIVYGRKRDKKDTDHNINENDGETKSVPIGGSV